MSRVAIIQGHPGPTGGHLWHALADAYTAGGQAAVTPSRASTLQLGVRLVCGIGPIRESLIGMIETASCREARQMAG
jgi:hypothetical protein